MKTKSPKKVFFDAGSLYIYGGRFVRWQPMRRGCGGEHTNKVEMGCIFENELLDWVRTKHHKLRRHPGVKAGQYHLRPYEPVYRTYRDAQLHRHPIRRPSAH